MLKAFTIKYTDLRDYSWWKTNNKIITKKNKHLKTTVLCDLGGEGVFSGIF